MSDSATPNALVFSSLLQNRRKYVSHLSAIGMSVDIFSDKQKIVAAAVGSETPVLIDLDTSEWTLSVWLETLMAEGVSIRVVFFTETKQSEMIERFESTVETMAAHIDFFCTSQDALLLGSSKELQRILELFNTAVWPT